MTSRACSAISFFFFCTDDTGSSQIPPAPRRILCGMMAFYLNFSSCRCLTSVYSYFVSESYTLWRVCSEKGNRRPFPSCRGSNYGCSYERRVCRVATAAHTPSGTSVQPDLTIRSIISFVRSLPTSLFQAGS